MKNRNSESARIYLTRGGGCSLVIAIPMIGIGALFLLVGMGVLYQSREPRFLAIAAGAFLFGGLILSVAVPVVSTREGVTLDRIHGTATQWRTIFGRYKTLAVHKLDEFHSIEIYNRKSPNRARTHVVQLTGDSKKLMLCDLGLLERAQEAAKEASEFVSLPVKDKTMVEDES